MFKSTHQFDNLGEDATSRQNLSHGANVLYTFRLQASSHFRPPDHVEA